MGDWIRHQLGRRPTWMNVLLVFCTFMALFYMPWDLFVKPAAIDEEVWFGIRFHGAAAKLMEIPHWFVYGAGMVGFWQMRSWMWPWAAVYVGQVAFSFAVWPLIYRGGFSGLVAGLVSGGLWFLLARALWRAKEHFQGALEPLSRYGSWALVTGASAGIGAAFARALAKDGVNVALVARREEKLRELADELSGSHGVEVCCISSDLASSAGVRAALDAVDDLPIAILVNNAGFGYSGRFDRQDSDRLIEMVRLNCEAPVALTAALLPKMRERGSGAVIFTGSVAGLQPLPLHALYSATKSFDNLLGEALWGELHGSGVDVLVLEPGSTTTEFQDVAGEIPHEGETAEKVVRVALRALGHQPSVISGVFNWIRGNAAMRLLPRSAVALVAKQAMEAQTPPELR